MSRRRTPCTCGVSMRAFGHHSAFAVVVSIAVGLVGLVGLVGCGARPVSLAEGPREYLATDYEHVLARWTRNENLVALSELDSLLTVTATFESWDFRWAYVVRYARDSRLSVERRRLLLDQTRAEPRAHHHFFVALCGGSNRRWNDLTKPNSAWIVRLI